LFVHYEYFSINPQWLKRFKDFLIVSLIKGE
jgi:hypothetical protein